MNINSKAKGFVCGAVAALWHESVVYTAAL